MNKEEYNPPDNLEDALELLDDIHDTLYCIYKNLPNYPSLYFDYHDPLALAHGILNEMGNYQMKAKP